MTYANDPKIRLDDLAQLTVPPSEGLRNGETCTIEAVEAFGPGLQSGYYLLF